MKCHSSNDIIRLNIIALNTHKHQNINALWKFSRHLNSRAEFGKWRDSWKLTTFILDVCRQNRMYLEKANLISGVVALFVSLTSIGASAQTSDGQSSGHTIQISIPQVSLIAIRGTNSETISLNATSPDEAGSNNMLNASDSSLWLNYTHVNSVNRYQSRNIYVRLSNGEIPLGFQLSVKAGLSQGPPNVKQGHPLGEVNLSTIDTKLIGGIQTTHTGFGADKGHRLIYRLSVQQNALEMVDYNAVSNVQVMYTIAD